MGDLVYMGLPVYRMNVVAHRRKAVAFHTMTIICAMWCPRLIAFSRFITAIIRGYGIVITILL